jgi:alpha-beta hydrolase superfamily lysophospholipase
MNIVAIFQSYKFTHFVYEKIELTKDPKKLSATEKISTLIFGINNPRPYNNKLPASEFETVNLQSNKKIECWSIKTPNSRGTVILFHGFRGNKSSMLDKSEIFREQGFNVFLVDFMGSGGSEGNRTTIGFLEAEQVKTSFEYIASKGEKNIILFGTSMGSVAIMKSISDFGIKPRGIIIECPFGSMYQTVCARFKTMNTPSFPMAGLLVFWGGIQNGFWGFGFNPTEYAKNIACPALLMYGLIDDKVSKSEIDKIFANLKGRKFLKIYKNAGHENYLDKYKDEWTKDITQFINSELK